MAPVAVVGAEMGELWDLAVLLLAPGEAAQERVEEEAASWGLGCLGWHNVSSPATCSASCKIQYLFALFH